MSVNRITDICNSAAHIGERILDIHDYLQISLITTLFIYRYLKLNCV